jgi:hypothetical protein
VAGLLEDHPWTIRQVAAYGREPTGIGIPGQIKKWPFAKLGIIGYGLFACSSK